MELLNVMNKLEQEVGGNIFEQIEKTNDNEIEKLKKCPPYPHIPA
jgi:hypothetical protein